MLSVNINSVSFLDAEKRRTILKDIKFDLVKGKVYTILGKNGSGKSTLIKSLTALLPKTDYEVKGDVFFSVTGGSPSNGNGTNVIKSSEEKLKEIRKRNIRYVFQDAANSLDPLKKLKYYFDLTNISPLKIEELLFYFLLPNYKKLSGLHSYELSGGMAQRLLIVLALLANPDLLILDEPTSGVDYAVTNLILLKIKNYVRDKDKSVLIVTQDINFAVKSSDYIAYLTDGNFIRFYIPNEFLNSPDVKVRNFINSFKEIYHVSA